MENSFKNIVDQSKSILILLPTKPFFDQAAAGLALYLALREDKEVQIYCPTPITVEFNRLVGVNKISQELGNKNLVIRFTDYEANNIERVSYDIEQGNRFRLTVIPKTNFNPPTKEQVEFSYSGVSTDTVIMVGGANESHFPALSTKELSGVKLVHVGIKDLSLSSDKNFISFARDGLSVSEVASNLIKESGFSYNEDIATNLLMGIEESTNKFSDPSMSAETFAIVSELMRAGGKRIGSQKVAGRQSFPPGAIPQSAQNQTSLKQDTSKKKQPQQGQVQKETKGEDEQEEEAPQDWLEPKIFKGTSVS